ncbi:MAG: hypothetical protein R3F11_21140 [Verrucomicrobiales bacterium]
MIAAAEDEDVEILRAAAYLQETGVAHSYKEKAIYSLQQCQHFFGDSFEELDPRLIDCIRNHVRNRVAETKEGRLMQICHKYAVTHYLDYMLLKHTMSPRGFEKLQLERIDAYTAYIRFHPRGDEIDAALQNVIFGRKGGGGDSPGAA